MKDPFTLSGEELSFFRLTLDLFPTRESPLRFLQNEDREPQEPEETFGRLHERDLLNDTSSGASEDLLARLSPVSECDARVLVRRGSIGQDGSRCFYIADESAVEYEMADDAHTFGEPLSEDELASELAETFPSTDEIRARPLSMSAGDYLVFAVFARDLRAKPDREAEEANDAPMSIDEVLAFFEEPETPYLRTPSDDSWRESIQSLEHDGVLVDTGEGHKLHPSIHPVAREILADRQHTVARFDYLDEHWLVREISLYPTKDTVYRLGTKSDGSVIIEELSTTSLSAVLSGVVGTLPNILNPDIPAMLKGAELATRQPI